ncbi:MAG: hypothetical protein ACTSQI_18185 [Candidatus Helarchaeota archaeon]
MVQPRGAGHRAVHTRARGGRRRWRSEPLQTGDPTQSDPARSKFCISRER